MIKATTISSPPSGAAARTPGATATQWSSGLQWLLSIGCGLLIANVYYSQPLTGLIAAALGMSGGSAGLLVTLPLAGYGIGLLTVVPLADLMENKRLVLALIAIEALCMLALTQLSHPLAYLAASFLVGLSAAGVQVLVPYASYFAPEAQRGSAVGRMVSGVMLGIMLSRPLSSAMAELLSWRAIFGLSALLMASLFIALKLAMPARTPAPGLTYGALLRSMGRIFMSTPVLRRRGFYQALLFAAFSVFWTAVPLWLSSPQFGLTQSGIAWVALAGVAGAIAPPFAGRLVDAGRSKLGTVLAMLLAIAAFAMTGLLHGGGPVALGVLIFAAICVDFAFTANMVIGQRAVYALSVEQRSRLNGLYMATFFAGGAVGSALGGWAYFHFGWLGVTVVGMALPALGLVYFLTEPKAA